MATCLLPLCPIHKWGWNQETEDLSSIWDMLGMVPFFLQPW